MTGIAGKTITANISTDIISVPFISERKAREVKFKPFLHQIQLDANNGENRKARKGEKRSNSWRANTTGNHNRQTAPFVRRTQHLKGFLGQHPFKTYRRNEWH